MTAEVTGVASKGLPVEAHRNIEVAEAALINVICSWERPKAPPLNVTRDAPNPPAANFERFSALNASSVQWVRV